eukprot:1159041-Pelagomonas_calceolata.AAC.7
MPGTERQQQKQAGSRIKMRVGCSMPGHVPAGMDDSSAKEHAAGRPPRDFAHTALSSAPPTAQRWMHGTIRAAPSGQLTQEYQTAKEA